MVKNILPKGVDCIFVRQPEQLGLGHAVLCAERAIGNDPFAVLLADDFLVYDGNGPTADLVRSFEVRGKTQLSIMEVNGPDISKYGVVLPGPEPGGVAGLVEKPDKGKEPSNFASIGRYVLTSDIFDIIRNQPVGAGGEIQLADAINAQAANNAVEAVILNGRRFIVKRAGIFGRHRSCCWFQRKLIRAHHTFKEVVWTAQFPNIIWENYKC